MYLSLKSLDDLKYDIGMICIDAFRKYCAIILIERKTKSDLALGFVECKGKMGGAPLIIMTDGEGCIITIISSNKYVSTHKRIF